MLECLVGAAASQIMDIAAGAAGRVLSHDDVKGWMRGVRKRAAIGRRPPANHDLVRGIRLAHLGAVKFVTDRHRAAIASLRNPGEIENETAFNRSVAGFIEARIKAFQAGALDPEVVTEEQLIHVLDELADPKLEDDAGALRQGAGGGSALDAARRDGKERAIRQALAELERDAGRRSTDLFEAVFRGAYERTGWYDVFALEVMEEIKTNERFRSIFFAAEFIDLKRLVAGVDAKVAELLEAQPGLVAVTATLRGLGDELAQALAALRAEVTFRGEAALSEPRIEAEAQAGGEADSGGMSRFGFRFALDRFEGREDDFAAVEAALLGDPAAVMAAIAAQPKGPIARRFRWQVLEGGAGSGKSRFALELLERNKRVWRVAGFVKEHAVTSEAAANWRVTAPTLLVIDYAAARPALRAFVEGLAQRANAGTLDHPVRLLLIERNASDARFEGLLAGHVGDEVGLTRAAGGVHRLAGLDEGQLVRLMERRVGGRTPMPSGAELLAALRAFDPACRPLFAAIVGDAIKEDALPEIGDSAEEEAARLSLFQSLIERERSLWLKRTRVGGMDELAARAHVARHERLALVATLVRGLRIDSGMELMGDQAASALLPDMETGFDRDLYAAMTGEAVTEALVPGMSPDLVGERFAIDVLQARAPNPFAPRPGPILLRRAWRIDGWSVAVFGRLAFQDFPQATLRLRAFLPDDPGPALREATALILGIAETVTEPGAKPTVEGIEAAFAVEGLIDDAILAGAAGHPEAARNVASTWARVANLAARAINPHIDEETFPADPEFQRRMEQPGAARVQFGRAATAETGP